MRKSALLTLTLTACCLGIFIPPMLAIQRPDGTVFFSAPPRLIDASTTFSNVGMFGAKYYFTLALPADAGEPLQRIAIRQRQGSGEIRYRLDETFAFLGTPNRRGARLGLATVTQDEDSETISVVFDSPVPPGSTFTLGLVPRKNPRYGGKYLFGVTAFPAGETSEGLYLGAARLRFYERSNGIEID